MNEYRYVVLVEAETQAEAQTIVAERLGYDEDLTEQGVGEYRLSWSGPIPDQTRDRLGTR